MPIYFVATTGSDSRTPTQAQSQATPWRTMTHAAALMVAGDTTIALDGTYVEPSINFAVSGTALAPITLKAQNKWGAILSSTAPSVIPPGHSQAAIQVNASYIVIQDLLIKVDPSISQASVVYSSANVAVRFWNQTDPSATGPTQSTGWVGSVCRGLRILAGGLASNGDHLRSGGLKSNQDNSEWDNCWVSDDLDLLNANNQLVHDCIVDGVGGAGAYFVAKGGCRNPRVYNNEIHNTAGGNSLTVGGLTATSSFYDPATAIEVYNGAFFNNVIVNNSGDPFATACAFRGAKDTGFTNNVCVGGAGLGASAGGLNSGGTAYGNQGSIVENNVFYKNGTNADFSPGNSIATMRSLVFDYNDTFGFTADVPSQAHPVLGDPKLIAPLTDWHLQAGSPCVEAGTTPVIPKFGGGTHVLNFDKVGVTRPQGTTYDLGIYEFAAAILKTYVGSGGLHVAGAATTRLAVILNKAYVGSGGLHLAGAGVTARGVPPAFQAATDPLPAQINVNPPLRTIQAPTFATYQAAIANAQYGDEIVLTPGVEYVGLIALPLATGTVGSIVVSGAILLLPTTLGYLASPAATLLTVAATNLIAATIQPTGENYVTIRSGGAIPAAGTRVEPGDAAQMPILRAPDANYCLTIGVPGVHHYRFVGLHFTTTSGFSPGGLVVLLPDQGMDRTQYATYPHHMSIESCYFAADEDYGVNKTIALQGPHMRVKDTYVTNAYQLGNGDANAVWMDNSPGPYLLENCLFEGMGENVFMGAESNSGVPIIPGFQYAEVSDVTMRKCHLRRRYSWKSDEPSYRAPCDLVGTGTFTTQGTGLKFSIDQAANLLVGHSIKRLSTNEVRKILSGTGTSYVLASPFTTDVQTGEAWRWNSQDLTCKNTFEVKGGNRILVEDCLFEKGWGGQGDSFTFTPRRNADISDFHMRYCKWTNTLGMAWSNGDWEQGLGLNASFRSTQRFRMEHVLWEHIGGPRTLPGSNKCIFWNVAGIEWGRFSSLFTNATCRASATTGVGIAFISNTPVFAPEYVGLQVRFGAGRATVTTVSVDGLQVLATITAAFPDTVAHPLYPGWRIGPAAFLDSTPYLIPDSAVFEHCTFAGVNTGYDYSTYLASNGPLNGPGVDLQPPVATNMVWRNNIQHAGVTPGNANGFIGEANLVGTSAADFYLERTTRDLRKNVLFGPALLTSFNFGAFYTGDMAAGAGSGHVWGLHDPDYNGALGGGPIGFVDYLSGDYRLDPSSPYHNWGTDGTDPGCDIATLNARLAGVASPDVP